MLVQFMLKNCLSFKETTIFDLTAIKAYKEQEYKLLDAGMKEKLVRVAAVYGANASGKSNLLFAIGYFKRIVRESANNVEDEEERVIFQRYFPFLFEEKQGNTELQAVLAIGKYEYKYGFEYNEKRIVSEWMYRKNLETNRNMTILERDEDEIYLGAAVRKECEVYKEQIPPETLALSFFSRLKLNTDVFRSVYAEIMKMSVLDTDRFEKDSLIEKMLPKVIDEDKEGLLSFLNAIDSGIRDIWYRSKEKETELWTVHCDKKGNRYDCELLNESQGTLKSIGLYVYMKRVIETDGVMLVDELNTKLHPLLLKFIIDLFYDEKSKAQLIYTTHDTTMLDKRFFRRDQIWFVQKDEEGHSELTALSDFRVRSDASFEKDYLAGVYGGIPLIQDFQMKEGD